MPFPARAGARPTACAVTVVGALAFAVGCRSAKPEPAPGPTASAAKAAPKASAPANALPIAAASVNAVVNPGSLPAYDGPTGSVEGVVVVHGPEAPPTPDVNFHACPAAIDTYGRLFRAGPERADGARPLADAVVVVTGYAGYYVPEKEEARHVRISTSCAYPSRTIAVTFGQRLEVVNESTLPFAPYIEGPTEYAVMVAPPQANGDPVKMYPPQAGYFALRDRLQPFVREEIYVLRHPLHDVTDLNGHFRIDGVPVGKLKVGARLAAIGSEEQVDVNVRANVVENVEINLAYAPNLLGNAKPNEPKGTTRRRTDPGGRLPPND